MEIGKKLSGGSRRDFFRVAGRYGMSSTLLAAGGFGGAMSLANLAQAAESTYEKRFSKEPKHTLKFGASGFNTRNLLIERAGAIEFARDLEERTDGEIRIEFIGDNQICGQLSCVEKTQQGIVDIYAASTQNSAGGAPYLNVLDYAYMFPSRAAQYHFFYSPESQRILRDPLEKRHGLKFLFTHCELRGLQMGSTFADKPTVTKLEELFGTKNRVTGTQLGRIAMQLLMRRPEITGFISVAPPANMYDFTFLAPCPSSGLIINGTADRVAPPNDTRLLVEKLHEQKGITITHSEIEGAAHFFEDPHMDDMIGQVDGYVRRRLTETTR